MPIIDLGKVVGEGDFVEKSKITNNFITTEEGFVADARALKVLNDKVDAMLVKRTYTIEMTEDPSVAPFTVYGYMEIGGEIDLYGEPISVFGVNRAKIPIPCAYLYDEQTGHRVFVVSHGYSPATITVVYRGLENG